MGLKHVVMGLGLFGFICAWLAVAGMGDELISSLNPVGGITGPFTLFFIAGFILWMFLLQE